MALCNILVAHENNPKGIIISADDRPPVTEKEWYHALLTFIFWKGKALGFTADDNRNRIS